MRAIRYSRYGPPDVLEVVTADEPAPRAGELLVRVRAAAATRSTISSSFGVLSPVTAEMCRIGA